MQGLFNKNNLQIAHPHTRIEYTHYKTKYLNILKMKLPITRDVLQNEIVINTVKLK